MAKTAVPPSAEEVGLNAIVEPGDEITYTITITNSGAGPVLNPLDVIDTLPFVPGYVTVDVIDHSPVFSYVWVGNVITFSNWFTFAVSNPDVVFFTDTFDSGLGSWTGDIGSFPTQWASGPSVVAPVTPWFTSGGNPNYAGVGSSNVAVDASLVVNVDATSCTNGTNITLQQ